MRKLAPSVLRLFLTSPYGFISNKTTERQLGLDGEIAFDVYMIYKLLECLLGLFLISLIFLFRNELNKNIRY